MFATEKSNEDILLAQMRSVMFTHVYLFHSSLQILVIVPLLVCQASWKEFLGSPQRVNFSTSKFCSRPKDSGENGAILDVRQAAQPDEGLFACFFIIES